MNWKVVYGKKPAIRTSVVNSKDYANQLCELHEKNAWPQLAVPDSVYLQVLADVKLIRLALRMNPNQSFASSDDPRVRLANERLLDFRKGENIYFVTEQQQTQEQKRD